MSTTSAATTSEMARPIFTQIDALLANLNGQVLVSQNRCVDSLLDLYNLVDHRPLQRAIEETLSDIRNVGSVEVSWLEDRVLHFAAAVEVESAFDARALPFH